MLYPDDLLDPDGKGSTVVSSRIITGDVSRVIQTSDPLKADDYAREIYLREVDGWLKRMYRITVDPKYAGMPFDRAGSGLLWLCLVLLILLWVLV